VLVFCGILALVFPAVATTIVYDPALHTQTLTDQIANYAKATAAYIKQVQQEVDEHTTMLKEIQQVENELMMITRMGDPKAYGFNLPGVSNITTLAAIYQQAQRDAADIAGFSNPQSLKISWEQIQSHYGQPAWSGFTSATGFRVVPATSLINFYASNYNVASSTQERIAALNEKKLELTQQRDQAIKQLQSASDQSAVQKQTAIIQALNGAIADVNAQVAQAVHAANLQIGQNREAQAIGANIAEQQRQAADYQVIDAGLNRLPLGSLGQPVLWGAE
jgi:hypothetical protein